MINKINFSKFFKIANITLILNLFLLVGILTLFEATLTLPGIAGIILTVGMAVDANVTTLIAAVILFIFGSGPVKGFAVTLGIGIVTTLFSAYFIARHLTSVIVLNDKDGKYFKL